YISFNKSSVVTKLSNPLFLSERVGSVKPGNLVAALPLCDISLFPPASRRHKRLQKIKVEYT
ncbi:MAG: hypothetical protein AABZ13_05840, partial [Planctomycetota bacterium]